MRRRAFIGAIGAAVTWPGMARAQQATKPPTIGYFSPDSAAAQSQWTATFVQRLGELGWTVGGNVEIEYRWADGDMSRLNELAAELVRRKPSVIVTSATPPTIEAKRATSVIPIVVVASSDPVGSGLVASLSHPGGNVTGFSIQSVEAVGKRLELLRNVVPDLRRLAVLSNNGNPIVKREAEDVEAAGRASGLEVAVLDARKADDIAPAFAALGAADALYVTTEPLFFTNKLAVNTLAFKARLPSIYAIREQVVSGGLLSYGASFADLFRRAAGLVDKILRGTKPADIPVEQANKFDLVINLKTATALGLAMPDKMLALADEVIE